ncbi:MAG TPA: alpha/beta hydrolase domain-containing protein [Acidimicrobiales bacterium]
MTLRRLVTAVASLVVIASSLTGLPTARATDDIAVNLGALADPPEGLRGHPLWDSYYELAPFGYEEREYFISGTAVTDDGQASAGYTTRFIVTRPTAASGDGPDFNGVVMVDWTNVTAQFENAVDTMSAREELMRGGYAFVHVSAQSAGICCTPLTPKMWDPVRYAALDHPGDAYAQDIFRQIADAVRGNVSSGPGLSGDDLPMAGLGIEVVIAAGQSQSGSRLNQYVIGYLAHANEARNAPIDAIIVHGSAAGAKLPLAQAARDRGVPVLHLLSDAEANDGEDQEQMAALLDGEGTEDSHYRLWEIAGTAHADFWIGYQSIVGSSARVLADQPPLSESEYEQVIRDAGNYGAEPHPLYAVCIAAGATMPTRYATNTAVRQVADWARPDGLAPAHTPRFEFDPITGRLARDDDGNAQGGMRLPPVEVPVATYRSTDCGLGGVTVPFLEPQLWERYPTFVDYWEAMAAATDQAVEKEWMLPADAADQMERVCAAKHRWPDAAFGDCPA